MDKMNQRESSLMESVVREAVLGNHKTIEQGQEGQSVSWLGILW
jgi:hypothetical protein